MGGILKGANRLKLHNDKILMELSLLYGMKARSVSSCLLPEAERNCMTNLRSFIEPIWGHV